MASSPFLEDMGKKEGSFAITLISRRWSRGKKKPPWDCHIRHTMSTKPSSLLLLSRRWSRKNNPLVIHQNQTT
jgi:hypothetical protein